MKPLLRIAALLLAIPLFLSAQTATADDHWNGYLRHNFKLDGRQCYLVDPAHEAPGKPWLWRARFFGHRPEVDLALLDKGFHLAYMDVVEMLGNPEAVEHWNHFYDLLTTRYGLSPKPALEGMSRGGLYVYSWAAANPTKVAAIYADAPVCDITTWPLTGADGKPSPQGWNLLSAAFGFKTPEDARAYRHNPIDILEPIAQAHVPLLHVVGDADDVVPVARNTAVLAARYQALGGEIAIIHKPGIGHKHGLDDPTPIIQFLLRNTLDPVTVVPQFQSGDVVSFIGDSLTHSRKWHKYVVDYYLTRFPDRKIQFHNAGISGDSAAGALARFDTDIAPQHPTVAVLMLGMNDVRRDLYASEGNLDARQKALDNYRDNMTKLVARLKDIGVQRFIFIVSSPFDETAQLATPNLPGVNEAVRMTIPILRDLALANHGTLVDFNTPLLELNQEGQRANPAYTLIGPDRVHPADPGMMVMAYTFLKAQDVPALVSKMTLDAKNDAASECIRCRIDGHLVAETSLPFPIEPSAQEALKLVPIAMQLDQEILAFSHLAPGRYRLTIDKKAAGEYEAADLAKGINLAFNPQAPQYRQAQEILTLNQQRHKLATSLRDVAKVEENILRPRRVSGDDEAAVKDALKQYLAANQNPYYTSLINSYNKTKPRLADVQHQMEELDARLEKLRIPQSHTYELAPAP
jgi:lysophospholipase L1-like esterase/pimeloyl-ACP methyl ester carboxylesterase